MSNDDLPTVVAESEMEFMGTKIRCLVLSNGMRVVPKEDYEAFMRLLGAPEIPRCFCSHPPDHHSPSGCAYGECECGWDGETIE